MFAILLSNLPGIITAFISAIPALLLAINTIVSKRTHKPLVLIDPAINLLGISYTALEAHELKAFRRLKLKKWSLILAFLLITYTAIYLFIDIFIISNYLISLYIGILTLVTFFIVSVYNNMRKYNLLSERQYPLLGLTSPNVEFVLFRKAEMIIQADYGYLIAKCYQALKSLKIQTVRINSDDDMRNSSLSSSRIAVKVVQTEKAGIYKISIEPVVTSNKTNDHEESSKSIEALMERVLDVPDNYTPPMNLNIRIES
jgi:hypothetical protein